MMSRAVAIDSSVLVAQIDDRDRRHSDNLIQSSNGKLSFHDAFMALVCQEIGVSLIASFDGDFAAVEWLKRLDNTDKVAEA